MTLFERVKETAKKRGYSLAELARRAGIGQKSIYTWKPSKTYPKGVTPSREVLEKVSVELGVTVDYLLGNEEKKTSASDEMHIDVEDIVDNAAMLTSRNHALSDEDRAAIKAMLTGYLNSKEGQRRLKKYGGYGEDKNTGENGDD